MQSIKIRDVIRSDMSRLKAVIDASGLFPSSFLDEMIEGYFSKTETCFWLTSDHAEPTFVAYCAPEMMTEGTWNLYLIAVHPRMQGKGVGQAVMNHIEALLLANGARLLIVETSGLPEFQATRAFYKKCYYTQEARIRDFYRAGEDKIVFWKLLTPSSVSA